MSNELPLIKIDNFEGPFDLLLELAAEQKIDVSDISLAKITDAFVAYLETKEIPPGLVADFVVIASTLLLLKIRQLLPELEPEEEEEIAQLSDRLLIYQQYRQQAFHILSVWHPWLLPAPQRLLVNHPVLLPDLTAVDLGKAMHRALENVPASVDPRRHLRQRGTTLRECLQNFQARLQQCRRLIFQDELRGKPRDTAAVSFLAVLELARQKTARLHQETLADALTVELL